MSTFLTPIEKPESLAMKFLYFVSKKKFGKVMTGIKVNSARMPFAFSLFYGKVSQLDKKLLLPAVLVLLIRQQVARINICEFCIDASRYLAIQKSMNLEKFDALADYSSSSLFSEREKAALAYVSQLTKEKVIKPETFDRLIMNFSEREIVEIVHVVATEHLYNISNIGLNIHSDNLCQIEKKPTPGKVIAEQ